MKIFTASNARTARTRGTAEIELLLSILVLISILLLVSAGARIGLARLNSLQTVENQALGNAATGNVPLYTDDPALPEVTREWDDRPGLPNRTHVAHAQQQVTILTGGGESVPPANISAIAGAISPGWTMSAYPVGGGDESMTATWFDGFIADSHPELPAPLLLAPSWKP
jgi:hypothetical protein